MYRGRCSIYINIWEKCDLGVISGLSYKQCDVMTFAE